MKYHPSRYYMLIAIPVIVLSARFITAYRPTDDEKLPLGRWTLKRLAMLVFWFYFIYYTGVSVVLSLIPFSIRKKSYDYAYFNIIHNNISRLSSCNRDNRISDSGVRYGDPADSRAAETASQ